MSSIMSQRESKQSRERERTKEGRALTEEEPDSSTKIAEGSFSQEHLELDQKLRDDPVLKRVASSLHGKKVRTLDHQEWYSFLQMVHNCSNQEKELTRMLNDITMTTASPHRERG